MLVCWELYIGCYNFLYCEWGLLEFFDDFMLELLKKVGIYIYFISDYLYYWEDGGGNYYNCYSFWDVVCGQEGDYWKVSVGELFILEVLCVL